ncbi:MAG: phage major capsid protein [Anaerostipes sp.]|nr:phage major capsid protein [Anaerostipes sp.]
MKRKNARKYVKAMKGLQLRAEDLKSLQEQRAEKLEEMKNLVNTAEEEKRAFEEEEKERFEDLKKEIEGIDATIAAIEEVRSMNMKKEDKKEEEQELTVEERAFVDYLRGEYTEERATNLTVADNGAIIPKTIMDKVIEKVVDICPIYQLSDKYSIGGTISIPYYDEETSSITMAYADEFTELTSSSGKFKSIDLSGYLAGALTLVSKKLMNNSKFDVLQKVIDFMAKAIAKFIEHECLIGTNGKATGALAGVVAERTITAAAAAAVTADELIDVQEAIPDIYQMDAIWIMNKATRTAIRKLKDSDGNYLLNRDLSAKWGYTLLGKDVYCSDNMEKMAAGKDTILYGDMSGLAVKVAEEASIEVLREKYATQHAVGVVAWMEIDTKVEDAQKLSKLKMKAS